MMIKKYTQRLFVWLIVSAFSIHAALAQDFTSFDGTKIAYTDEGSGTAVLLIHGFIQSGGSWNQAILRKALIDAGHRVIVPDLRGNGKSDKPQKAKAYANDAEIKDLKALMSHLGIEKYMAVGYSRGSIVLAKLLTKDKRIQKAVLGGMGLDFTDPQWPRKLQFTSAFLGTSPLTDETRGAVTYAKSIGADIKALGYLQLYQPVTSVKKLSKVKIPVLVIAGDEDHDNGEPSALSAVFPNGKLLIIKGDHNNSYKSQAFSDGVMDFLVN